MGPTLSTVMVVVGTAARLPFEVVAGTAARLPIELVVGTAARLPAG
jgi:hypothetical protein